ncbi:UNVERIFIED_CONTAM: hypothetical protein Sradi_5298500 [Sesamum radiatum]|uniref:DUF659 domain-containing protein n=1 Tax=Sesamum radiatum TaxID=300843 RepID=A0AAW2LME5_SESRA
MRGFIRKKKQVKDQINAIPHFDDVAEEEMRWETEQEQQNIAGCKRNISYSGEGSSTASTMASKKETQLGPINLYFTKESNEAMQQRKGKEAKVIDKAKKKLRENAVQKICRWMYDAGPPFNAVNYESLGPAIEAIRQYGPGMKPPSYYEVRVKYLKKELEHTNNILKVWEEDQAKYGCSLMADGWTNRKHHSLINFLVNSPKGTKFIGSVDASSYSHTGEKLFELLDKYVQQIGEKNVIQVITDSASANVLAAHCIDLMFEDFFKIPNLKKTYEQAVIINGYIYNRSPLLDMLRDFIAKRDMVRPAKIRFATAFLTLKRFHTKKANLKKMFTSEKWTKSKYAKEAQGKLVASTMSENSFWNNVIYILKVVGPLVKYNRALRRRYDARDTIDPIALDDIDESNEWLLGRLNLSEEDGDEENARVFEGDDLTWGDVVRAFGVDEDAYTFRPRHSKVEKNTTSKASSSKATKKASTSSKFTTNRHLIDEDEEEEEINFDDTDEEDLDCYKSNSDRENKTNDDDDEEEIWEDLDFD